MDARCFFRRAAWSTGTAAVPLLTVTQWAADDRGPQPQRDYRWGSPRKLGSRQPWGASNPVSGVARNDGAGGSQGVSASSRPDPAASEGRPHGMSPELRFAPSLHRLSTIRMRRVLAEA